MADLLLALDVKGKSEAVRVANACTGEVDSIKIGYPLVLSTGLGIVKDLSKADIPIIADFKVADIPNTNSLICEEVFDMILLQPVSTLHTITAVSVLWSAR